MYFTKKNDKYVDALITGNEIVIKEMYSKFFPKITSFVLSNRGDAQDASDVFHDGLMYIIVTQKEKRKPIHSFEGYLFVICKNIWLKQLKKKVIKQEVMPLIDSDMDLSRFIIKQQMHEFYIEKFSLLSDNCKTILGSYFNGLSYDAILEEHQYASINTVRQRVFKCRSKLISLIKSDDNYLKIKQWRHH
ncbi:MAG: sigma-70 family RNA polymerase sigma factor [Flavobacteriaceae bacterium]|nr:sigma-70 family RNA polymerase sigma factor [Flavobacteriaceae bacterium]